MCHKPQSGFAHYWLRNTQYRQSHSQPDNPEERFYYCITSEVIEIFQRSPNFSFEERADLEDQ
jgi:hypothetical protein